jgi:LPS sulfotransferase NodH
VDTTRTDRIRQGISYYRALETKRWRSTDTSNAQSKPPFNFEAIQSLIRLCEWEDAGWQEFFENHAIAPLVVRYEEFAERPEATARRIGAAALPSRANQLAGPVHRRRVADPWDMDNMSCLLGWVG